MRFRLVSKSTILDDLERRTEQNRTEFNTRIQGLLKAVATSRQLSQERVKLRTSNYWPVHSQGPSEQKPIKNFGQEGAWAYPRAAQSF